MDLEVGKEIKIKQTSSELFILFFFFQAEDGIRDKLVTGVQTRALPISIKRLSCALLMVPSMPGGSCLNARSVGTKTVYGCPAAISRATPLSSRREAKRVASGSPS